VGLPKEEEPEDLLPKEEICQNICMLEDLREALRVSNFLFIFTI
jgi:hypothetical protein